MISGENRRQNKGSQGHLPWQGLADYLVQCPHLTDAESERDNKGFAQSHT